MLFYCFIYLNIFIILITDGVRCASSLPKGCNNSLGARKDGSLNASAFSASSHYGPFLASEGRLTSSRSWIPKVFKRINTSSPEFLQVDLGMIKTITAVETEGYGQYFVTKFQIFLSADGKEFFQYQKGKQNEFTANTSRSTMNYLVCPATARYIRFVPTSFVNYIALAVEIYGCDDNFQVEGIENLRFIFVKSNEVTIAWTTIMNYSNQSVSYKPLDGDVFYKSLPFDGKSEHSERIVKLKPCTMYTIMVEMVNECNPPPKSINITTHDEAPESPTILSSESPKPFSALIKWKPPTYSSGTCRDKIIGYRIEYQVSRTLDSKFTYIPSPGTEKLIQGLTPWLTYEFKVFSVGQFDNSTRPAVAEVEIKGKAPEQPVTITSLQSKTPDSFELEWEDPPLDSVHGQIMDYAIKFKEKQAMHWSMIVTTLKQRVVKPLQSGKTYQVTVTVHNNRYGKSTNIREIFVGRKGPFESKELTDSLSLTSQGSKMFMVSWKIPGKISAEGAERVSIKYRRSGEQNWNEIFTAASKLEVVFNSLTPWHVYEAMLTLNTTTGIYYTKIKKVLVTGSAEDAKNLIQITSLVSKMPGKVIATVQIPKQYVTYRKSIGIYHKIHGSSVETKEVIDMGKTSEKSFEFGNLQLWQYSSFHIVARIWFPIGSGPIFGGRKKDIFVIGYSPGKAPSNVQAKTLSTTSISVSWTKIPERYITDDANDYDVFYTTEDGKETFKRFRNYYRSVNLTNLQPETTYSIKVAGVNKTGGIGPRSGAVTVKTFKDPRTPVIISAKQVSETEVSLRWKQPIEEGQTRGNFEVIFTEVLSKENILQQNFSKGVEMEYREVVDGLRPNTLYRVVISAFKVENGVIKRSDSVTFPMVRTSSVPPPETPTLISAAAISANTIKVRWKSKIDAKSRWMNFSIIAVDELDQSRETFISSLRSESYTRAEKEFSMEFGQLKPFHTYKFHVIGVKDAIHGRVTSLESNKITVQTMEAAPSAPMKFKLKIIDGNHRFSWKRPRKLNGVIRSYHLEIYDAKRGKMVLNETVVGKKKTFQLGSGLKEFHAYRAILSAFTVVYGPSAEINFTSAEGRPSAPRVTKVAFNGTHILIKWESPMEPNGKLLRYQIQFSKIMSDGKEERGAAHFTPASQHSFTIKENSYGSKVVIQVAAETSIGGGPFSEKSTVLIDPKKKPKPKAPPQPVVNTNRIKPTTIVIELKPLMQITFSLQVSVYQIIVEKVNGGGLQRRAVGSLPKSISNHSTASKNGDRYYIAAEFKPDNLPKEFVVGNGKSYNGYQNAPLLPRTVYAIHMRAVAVDENGDEVYGPPSSIRLPATAPRKANKESEGGIPLPIVAGVTGALLLLIILVVIIILYLRSGSARRRRSKERNDSFDVELSKLRTQVDPGEQRPVSLTGDFPLYPDHLPISVANYNNHVSKMLRNKASGFRCEYNQLEMGKEYSWEMAHLVENKPKNRFANIVAYDHARVILGKVGNNPGSDYINASYIDGYMKPNAYVATQGPLPGTFNDFWRMVWELRTSVVVMLTNLQEKNKLKCHKYWPDDCVEYGEIIVTQTRKEMYADYIIRTFLLDRTDSPESREVKHFHFTVWPDHGVPKYATALLAFRRRVRSYNMPDSGPTVVHCSAGVGRTGTYIALDATLDRMNVYGDIDVFNFVAAMRTRRIAMVQTEEQYIFIHNAILESVQCGNTEIIAHELRIMINKLEQVSAETKMNGFEREWKTLNNVSPIPSKSSCNIAALSENMPKNRNQNACILPADYSLVRLLPIEDDESTAYINAVYVDGYKQRNAYILTQTPLKNTVLDFWRMLCEHKSAAVVLLCSLDEAEDFVKFWPEMHIREYEMITVECLSKVRGDDEYSLRNASRHGETELVTRQFRVEDSRYPEYPMMVKLFHYVGWSETKVPNTCNYVIKLINQLERWQQQSGNGPITIVCSDGLGRSGTFAALNAVLERVKMEQVVDVFQAIKAMRIQRAHLVKTLEQYKFIYNCVEEYLNAFDDYANFK